MKTVVIGIRKLIRCSWHACFFFFFFRWMDSDCDGLSYFSCRVSVSLYIASKCTNSIFKSAEPTATKWSILLLAQCDSQATVKHQPLHMWASRERWLASCHQFNSGSKIVLFMCLFPYWFDCWFRLNGLGWDWIWIVMPQINLNMNTNQLCAHWVSIDRRALVDMCRIKLMINIVTVNNGI